MKKSVIEMDSAPLVKVISGGQDGVDVGALRAARTLGVETGGWAPLGYRTHHGCASELALFGLKQADSTGYAKRTILNVCDSDGTLIIASNLESPGTALTRAIATKRAKPLFEIQIPKAQVVDPDGKVFSSTCPALPILADAVSWLRENAIRVLNVAGNSKPAEYHEAAAYEIVTALVRALRES